MRRAMFAFFQDFTEYIVDMCESYIIVNDGKLKGSISATGLIDKAWKMFFLMISLKDIFQWL